MREVAFKHSSIISPIFELIRSVVFDVQIGNDRFTVKLELFQCVSDANLFRANLWGIELFNIQPTTRQPGESDDDSSEALFIDRSWWFSEERDVSFRATTPVHALQQALDDVKGFLAHATAADD